MQALPSAPSHEGGTIAELTARLEVVRKRFYKAGSGKDNGETRGVYTKTRPALRADRTLIDDLFLVFNLQADRFKEDIVSGTEDKQDEAALHALHILSVITKVASPSFHVQSSTGDAPRERASVQQTRVKIDRNVSSRVCNTFLTQLGYASSLSSVNMGDLDGIHEQRARYIQAFSRVRSDYTTCCTCRAASIMGHACAWYGSNPHAVASALNMPTESTSCLAAWNQREATIVRVVRGEAPFPPSFDGEAGAAYSHTLRSVSAQLMRLMLRATGVQCQCASGKSPPARPCQRAESAALACFASVGETAASLEIAKRFASNFAACFDVVDARQVEMRKKYYYNAHLIVQALEQGGRGADARQCLRVALNDPSVNRCRCDDFIRLANSSPLHAAAELRCLALRDAEGVRCSRELRENCGMFLMAARAIARPLSKRHKRRRTTPTSNEDASSTASTSSTTSAAPSTEEGGASVVQVAVSAVLVAERSGELTMCMQTILDWEHAVYGRALHAHELGEAMRLMLRALLALRDMSVYRTDAVLLSLLSRPPLSHASR